MITTLFIFLLHFFHRWFLIKKCIKDRCIIFFLTTTIIKYLTPSRLGQMDSPHEASQGGVGDSNNGSGDSNKWLETSTAWANVGENKRVNVGENKPTSRNCKGMQMQ